MSLSIKERNKYEDLRVEIIRRYTQFLEGVKEDPRCESESRRGVVNVIAEDLQVSPSTVLSYTADISDGGIFVDNDEGVWIDEERTLYVNYKYIAGRVSLAPRYVSARLAKAEVPYIILMTNVKRNRPQRFFKLSDIYELDPALKIKLEDIERVEALPDESIMKSCPPRLKKNHFLVLCALIIWRNETDYWPTNQQLASALRYHSFSVNYIKTVMRKLQKSGYISVCYDYGIDKKGRKSIKVHWGPNELITKKVECGHCGKVTYVARDYVKNGATG